MAVTLGMTVVAVLLTLWFAAPYAWRKISEGRLRRLCRQKRAIVLTYDDGPGEYLTGRLLETLRQKGVRGTFFLLGRRIDSRPDMAARVAAAGHEIGSHSYAHLNAWKSLPHKAGRDFLEGAKRTEWLSSGSMFFRPPHGKITLALLISVLRRGCRLGWWTIDSRDSGKDRLDVERVINRLRREKGGVVLMHDYDSYRLPDHEKYILTLTENIVRFATAEGYMIVTLGELLAPHTALTRDECAHPAHARAGMRAEGHSPDATRLPAVS